MRQRQLVLYAALGAVAYWWLTRKPAAVPATARATDQIAALSQMGVAAGNQSGSIVTGPHDAQLSEQTPTMMEPWPGAGYSVPVYPG